MFLSCLICGEKKFNIIRRKLRFEIKRDVLRCKSCGFVFLRPIVNKNKDDNYYQNEYRKKYSPNLNKVSAAKKTSSQEIFDTYFPFQEEIIKEIEYILRPNTKILDVGCSTGHFLTALQGKVGTRAGIELTKDAVNFIKRNLDFKVYSKPIGRLNIKEGPFDVITSLQVLEHVDDPLLFLKEIGKNLKPKGYLYLELPNIDDVLLTCFNVAGYEDFYYREPHLSYFSKNTLRRLLRRAGFVGKIKTVQRYNFFNHLHWIQTNGPQSNFAIGNSIPKLIADGACVPSSIKKNFNNFIGHADREYKKIVEKHGLGESLCFLGQKKSS